MKLEKLVDAHVLTGVFIGALIGIYFPLGDHKVILTILAAVMSLRVVGVLK